MVTAKITAFEVLLLVVGIAAAFLGFQLINKVFLEERVVSLLMIIAIFTWLNLLVLFISLSLAVDVSKKQLIELKNIVILLSKKSGKK
ncbi:MAG TPA: hypothetical protein EYO89_02385 [Candidatus Dadabacteria bacterium]|nr:hypothetical protein [Candidatus Dadabacteria bacterium]